MEELFEAVSAYLVLAPVVLTVLALLAVLWIGFRSGPHPVPAAGRRQTRHRPTI